MLEVATFAWPEIVPGTKRPAVVLAAVAISLAWGALRSLPPVHSVKKFPSKSVQIELTVDDILDPKSNQHIAVLSSDYFDTCVNTAISARSLMGKIVTSFFGGVISTLDALVDQSLQKQGITGTENPIKKHGTNRPNQFRIGTFASDPLGARKALIVVASNFDDATTKTTTTAEALWISLLALWRACLVEGHRETIAIPIWGANLGNAPGNRLVLFETILCSFAAASASQHQPPTKHLRIVVWQGDYDPDEFREMADCLQRLNI